VSTTRQRTAGQFGIPYVSDGWEPHETTIRTTYRERELSGFRLGWNILRPTESIRLGQAVKHRKGRRLTRVEVRLTIGAQVDQHYPVHIERFNGTLRDCLGSLMRKTTPSPRRPPYGMRSSASHLANEALTARPLAVG
jgi:hypothetical protein